jgi:hypothetical protein
MPYQTDNKQAIVQVTNKLSKYQANIVPKKAEFLRQKDPKLFLS